MRSEKKFKEEYKLRTRSRATVMAIILLAFSVMNVPGLIGPQGSLGVAQGQPSDPYPVVVSLGGSKIFFATHTDSKVDGNWIKLSDGTPIELPSLNFVYVGPSTVSYSIGGITVEMDSDFIQGLTYPLLNHQVYNEGDSVSSTFWGSTDLKDEKVSFMLLRLSALPQVIDIINEGVGGNILPLLNSLDIRSVTLNSTGDGICIFNALDVGDYLLAVVKIDAPNFYVYSATFIEIVDYNLEVSASSSVEQGDPVYVNSKLTTEPTGSYTHVAAMIKESVYSSEIKITTDEAFLDTKLYLNGVQVADGNLIKEFFLGTKDQSYLTIDLVRDSLTEAFDSNELAFGYITTTHTGSMSLSTSSLDTGDYTLLVGVWGDSETRLVGIKQTTITIEEPYKPPPIRPKNKRPTADAGPNVKIPVNGTIYFSGSRSYDKDGYILSYSWDFGDGTIATEENVSHTYTEPGHYTVTLTVKDNRYAQDSDKCEVIVWEWPAPVADKFGQLVPGEQKGFKVNALKEANTTITLDTSDQVTVTVLKYDDNPHPDDPIPATAIKIYVDVEVSDPDAVIWPIYVEMFYTDEDVEGLDEASLGIYYWKDEAWQRCSNTGVNTMKNVVWAYMTADEASGSPILMGGIHAIPVPPLPPILSNLNITPQVIELGDNVTISFDITNIDNQSITYMVDMQIGYPVDTQIGYLTFPVEVELEAYESKTMSRTMFPTAVGDFNVTVSGMTGSFKVKAVPSPAEFEVSDLTITPLEVEPEEEVEISLLVKNIGDQQGSYMLSVLIENGQIFSWVSEIVLDGGTNETVRYKFKPEAEGNYTVEFNELIGNFTVKVPPTPAEFVLSNFAYTSEIQEGESFELNIDVLNVGETAGKVVITIEIDGEVAHTLESYLEPGGGASQTWITFHLYEVGTHTIQLDGFEGAFDVIPKVIPFWETPEFAVIAIFTIVLVGVAAYIYIKKIDLSGWK